MAHDERHSPPRGDNLSPHHDDVRSRHDLDDDRHRRDHYDHQDHRRGPPGPPGHGNGVSVAAGSGPDDRAAPNDRGGPDENDRRDDRDNLDNRRYRGHDEHNPHNDRHHDYPEGNHHDRDRRDSLGRHGDPRQDDRQPGPPGPPDHRADDRGHDERHMRNEHDRPNNSLDNPDNVARHSPPQPHDHNPQDPGSAAPPPDHADHNEGDDSLINLFVRNVAKHVQEHQLIELFSKVCNSNSSITFSFNFTTSASQSFCRTKLPSSRSPCPSMPVALAKSKQIDENINQRQPLLIKLSSFILPLLLSAHVLFHFSCFYHVNLFYQHAHPLDVR